MKITKTILLCLLFLSMIGIVNAELRLNPTGFDPVDFALYRDDSNAFNVYYIKNLEGEYWGSGLPNSQYFGYETSNTLQIADWTVQTDVLDTQSWSSNWSNYQVFAPNVFRNGSTGNYIMFFTGLTNWSAVGAGYNQQRIGLAISNNLKDWTPYPINNCENTLGDGCVYDCTGSWSAFNSGLAWTAVCRDPYVTSYKINGYYYMFVTAVHQQWAQVIDVARSTDLINWEDVGPINRTKTNLESALQATESPQLYYNEEDDSYYLFLTSNINTPVIKYLHGDRATLEASQFLTGWSTTWQNTNPVNLYNYANEIIEVDDESGNTIKLWANNAYDSSTEVDLGIYFFNMTISGYQVYLTTMSDSVFQQLTPDFKLNRDLNLLGNKLKNGTIDWNLLFAYPMSCPAGTYITSLNDAVTCAPITTTNGNNFYIGANITDIDRACFDSDCLIYIRYNGSCLVSSNDAEVSCI